MVTVATAAVVEFPEIHDRVQAGEGDRHVDLGRLGRLGRAQLRETVAFLLAAMRPRPRRAVDTAA